MGRNYVERTKQEFDDLLIGKYKFRLATISDGVGSMTREFVYQRDGAHVPYSVRVYSSVHVSTGRTRECGEDAIRVVMVEQATGRPRKIMGEGPKSKAGRRINRTKNAMRTLERRIREYMLMGTPEFLCSNCGSLMSVRNGKHGKFLGCTKWAPNDEGCPGVRSAPDWLK